MDRDLLSFVQKLKLQILNLNAIELTSVIQTIRTVNGFEDEGARTMAHPCNLHKGGF